MRRLRVGVWREVAGIAAAVAAAMVLALAIVWLTSDEPARAYRAFLLGPVSSPFRFGNFLERSVPLTFTGLAVAVAFRSRSFNIGVEGQLWVGALAGTLVGLFVPLPRPVHAAAAMAAGALAGAAFAALPGYLKARWDANEVVTTLMLNSVAVLGVSHLLYTVLRDPRSGYAQTPYILPSARLDWFFPPSRLHAGIFVAFGAAAVVYWFLFHSRWGYELRMVGLSQGFARYGGINVPRALLLAMVVSGALAGLGGIVEVLGIHQRLLVGFSPGYGYTGIVVALLARSHPLAVPFAALFYAYLDTGSVIMERTSDVSAELVSVIQGVLFLFVTAEAVFAGRRGAAGVPARGGSGRARPGSPPRVGPESLAGRGAAGVD